MAKRIRVDRTIRERRKRYNQSPKGKYFKHKVNARRRGIPFELTFDEWWGIWDASGRWDQRGNRGHHYVMCRYFDQGAYSKENVYIGSMPQNTADRNRSVVHGSSDDVPF